MAALIGIPFAGRSRNSGAHARPPYLIVLLAQVAAFTPGAREVPVSISSGVGVFFTGVCALAVNLTHSSLDALFQPVAGGYEPTHVLRGTFFTRSPVADVWIKRSGQCSTREDDEEESPWDPLRRGVNPGDL